MLFFPSAVLRGSSSSSLSRRERGVENFKNSKNVFHQAILMNGVSGSGKTTTSKMLIRYMIYASQMRRNSKCAKHWKLRWITLFIFWNNAFGSAELLCCSSLYQSALTPTA